MHTPQHITLFGGSGFIGRHIVRRLVKTGAILHVPTRDPDKALTLKPMGDVGQIVPMLGSVRSDNDIARAIGRSETVINLLGILCEQGRNSFQAVHVETAARIARVAREQGVTTFIHLSALGVRMDSPSAYARSKAAGEQAVRTFFPKATILRPSIVFGPEDNFFNRFARLARFSPMLPLIGGGVTKFQPVYVGDVADAVMKILDKPEARGQVYELAGSETYSFRALIELLLKVTGRRRCLIPLPWSVAMMQAALMDILPNPMLTRDQVRLLKTDNIIMDPKAKTLRDLGVMPTLLETILPTYVR